MDKFNFIVLTDTHFFKNSLGATGKEYDEFMRFEQKCFAETESINQSVFNWLNKTDLADTVLIAGDLSFNGEYESHLGFIELLKKLKDNGKRIFTITADHDFKRDDDKAFAFTEEGRYAPKAAGRDELFDLYYEFGFKDAIAIDKKHLSYVAQLCDGIRLLALNNDGNCRDFKTYDDEQLAWIKEQTAKARQDKQLMIAMNHYPLLPGQPIFSVVPSAVQQNAGEITTMLADEGVHLVFTGHMHNQSINEKITPNGNKFYDVCTGSVIASPSVMRLVTVESRKKVKIKTINCPDFEWETNGRTCTEYLDDMFDSMILNLLDDMRNNPERMLGKFGAGDKTKLFPIVKRTGNALNKLTVGTTARLLCIKCDKSIKHILLKNYIAELVRNLFSGNQTFKEGTPKGDILLRFLKRFNFILKRINLKNTDGIRVDLFDILKNSAGNYGIDDYNAELILED